MSADESLPNRGESTHQLPTEATIRELVETERARLQMMVKSIEVEGARDRRHFEYASATRDANLQQEAVRQAFLRLVVWVFSGGSAADCGAGGAASPA